MNDGANLDGAPVNDGANPDDAAVSAGADRLDEATGALLRHTLATLLYRGGKVLRDAPDGFAAVTAGHGTRSAGEILAHLGDLFDWACGLASGRAAWNPQPPSDWQRDTVRFIGGVRRLDELVARGELTGGAARLFQGPIADALTHVGQLALLRRLAGAPVPGENYYRADIGIAAAGLPP